MSWYLNKDENTFYATPSSCSTMAPGFYETSGFAPMGLKPLDIQSDELIDLPGTVVDELYDDLSRFMSSKDRFVKCGLTHKRGYLLYGPPGGGKTSVAQLLARRFIKGTDGIVVHVASYTEFVNIYEEIYSNERDRETLFIIEECDDFINNAQALSILDGEKNASSKVFVAMTNYVEELPPRIMNRPGRFDRVVRVNAPAQAVQLEYMRRIRVRDIAVVDDVPMKIVAALDGLSVSLAHLREAYIAHVILGVELGAVTERFKMMQRLQTENEESAEE